MLLPLPYLPHPSSLLPSGRPPPPPDLLQGLGKTLQVLALVWTLLKQGPQVCVCELHRDVMPLWCGRDQGVVGLLL